MESEGRKVQEELGHCIVSGNAALALPNKGPTVYFKELVNEYICNATSDQYI